MAEHQGIDGNKAVQMDYPEHERTYGLFLGLIKYGSIAVIVILVGMAIFLV